jgi:putative FmdB family regulatory protein
MPVYEYMCERCGPFTAMRPMAKFDQPCDCPDCDHAAPRVMLTAPRHATGMSQETRLAHAVNEKSSHAPRTIADYKAKHPAGCSCCSSRSLPKRKTARGKDGSKSFPTARPWMISH